jgi:hypothetical protein
MSHSRARRPLARPPGHASPKHLRWRHIALALVFTASMSPSVAHPEPHAAFGPTQYDFGNVRRGEKVLWAFQIRNVGDTPLELKGVQFSRPGMTARLPGQIEADKDGTMSLEWATDRVQGSVRGVAIVQTNDRRAPSVTLVLTGTVHAPIDIEPIPAVFLSAFRGEDVHRELTLRSNQPGPVTLRLLPDSRTHYVAALEPVEPGRTWRLTVKPAPGTLPGRYEETLRIGSDDSAIGMLDLAVNVFVKADVYTNPTELDFGEIRLSRIRQQPGALGFLEQFIILKKRAGTFRLRSLRSDVAALALRATPASSESGTFRIDAGLLPEGLQPGTLEGTIWIETDDPEFPRLVVHVRGRLVEE